MPPLEDRVVSTTELRAFNDDTRGWLQLGPGILNQLDELSFHVVVPVGHLHTGDDDDDSIMAVMLRLRTVDAESLWVRGLIPHRMYKALPSAFVVLGRIEAIAGAAVAQADEWLYSLDEEGPDAG